jgi:hypothetical protein
MAKPEPSMWAQAGPKLLVAIVAPLVISLILSAVMFISFRQDVVNRFDSLTQTVQEIKKGMVSKDYVDESLHGITDRLAADERDIALNRSQLHDDEMRNKH